MDECTFCNVAMSRGQISRWALCEVGASYEQVVTECAVVIAGAAQ
jgi:hypothetical protein